MPEGTEHEPAFTPAAPGDWAAVRREDGWLFGLVIEVNKSPARVRLIRLQDDSHHKVGPRDIIRVLASSKVDTESLLGALQEARLSRFTGLDQLTSFLRPHRRDLDEF